MPRNKADKCSCDKVLSPLKFNGLLFTPDQHWRCTAGQCRVEDQVGAIYTVMHWDTLGSASHRRNWQGRGSGYFRIRRLSRPDASPYHRHHRHHCYPSSSSPTLEYREAVCAWCIGHPDTIAYDPIWCISSRPAHTQPPSVFCCHQEYDNVWLYFNLKK